MLLIIVCFVLLCNDDDENDSFLFVSTCLRMCGEKGEQSRRQRNGVLFVLVSLLLVSRVFLFVFDNSSKSVCVWLCFVSVFFVIVVVLVRVERLTK